MPLDPAVPDAARARPTPARTCGGCRCGASTRCRREPTVVVTGGKRGIGTAITRGVRGRERRAALQLRPGRDRRGRRRALLRRARPVDVLVNNAGVSSSAPVKRTTLAEWERQLDVNATGAFLCTRAVLEGMLRARLRADRHRRLGRQPHTARATRRATRPPSTRCSGSCASLAAEVAGTRRDRQLGLPGLRAQRHDRRARSRTSSGAPGRDGEAALVAMSAAGPADRARGGRVRGRVLRGARGGRDQRPVADHRRRGDPAMSAEFGWEVRDGVGFVTLIGAERKNPLTFESYAALRDHFRELQFDDAVKVVVIAGEQGNFCSGGDVHDIIGPLTEMDMRGLLRFTRMTGDLVKAIRGLPAAGDRGDRRRLRRRGRDDRDRVGPPARHAAGEGRVPVHARGARRVRHGRVRDAAADHRPGPRRGAAVHGPLDGRRGGGALGVLQPPRRPGRGRGRGARRVAGVRPDVRALDDQDDARPGVGHVAARRDRGRGAGAGDLHADPGLRARLPRVPGARSARSSRATDARVAVLRGSAPRVRGVGRAGTCRRPTEPTSTTAAAGFVRALARDGWLGHAVGEPLDVRTLCLARETLARHDGLADFAFAMQGLGSGPISLFGEEAQRARYLPAVAPARRSRRSRSRSPRRAPTWPR